MNARLPIVLLLMTVVSSVAWAVPSGPPSSANSNGVLPLLRGTGGMPLAVPRALFGKLNKDTPLIAASVKRLQDAVEGGNIRKLRRKEIAQLYMEVLGHLRDADNLLLWGEPAAIGFKVHLTQLQGDLRGLISAMRKDAYHGTKINREAKASKSAVAAKVKLLEKTIDPLIGKGKIKEAHAAMLAISDQLESVFVFYDYETYEKERREVGKRIVQTDKQFKSDQVDRILSDIDVVRAQLLPEYDKLWRSVEDLVLKVKNAEPVEPGPVLMKTFAGGWAKTHMLGLRCQAMDSVIAPALTANSDAASKRAWSEKQKELVEAHKKFTEKMGELIVALIEADTNRSSAEQIDQLYPQYLEAVSLLMALSAPDSASTKPAARGAKNSTGFRSRVEAALKQMAEKSTSLTQQIADYEGATGDLMHWRRKVAAASAETAQKTYSSLSEALIRAASRAEDRRERLLDDEEAKLDTLSIATYARVPTQYVSERVMGVKVFVRDGIGFRTATNYPLLTRLVDRHYAGFRGDPKWIAQAVSRLESDLLVNPQRPTPLTLDAQLAVSSARRGDMAALGGRINGMLLESVLTRRTALTPSDWGMVRISGSGALNSTKGKSTHSELLKQVQARFSVQPLWLQHECFFVDLSADEKNGN